MTALDSAAPSIPIKDFHAAEARFAILTRTDPDRAADLAQGLEVPDRGRVVFRGAVWREAGPEAVVPLDRAGGIGGGMNVTVNMPPGSDGADVVAALQRYARAHGGTVPILTGQL